MSFYLKMARTTKLGVFHASIVRIQYGRGDHLGALIWRRLLLEFSAVSGCVKRDLILNIAVAIKAVGDIKRLNIGKLDIAALLAVLLQLLYIIHGFIYEAAIFTTSTIMYEGTGYMTCVSHLLYPFLTTLTTRFILYQKLRLNYFAGISILSFVMGYALYRASNLRKDEFRKNPVSPTIPYLETIPTLRGNKLMSGLWGYVRHPNYLGNIIMQWSIEISNLLKRHYFFKIRYILVYFLVFTL